ncbi:hypothetical protein [Roseovarius nitratireducens]|uniref:hypothetical protein n=1 Tax=Roseovarius nitratireducens TaxID=2044597 RepID=UPI0013EAA94A|nr:hypothetical protein [Roseovarius nitratireducens]
MIVTKEQKREGADESLKIANRWIEIKSNTVCDRASRIDGRFKQVFGEMQADPNRG